MTIENSELTRQFPVLDSLRAVGSFAVVLTHTAFWSGAYSDYGIFGPFLARLDVGVAIFFVLSGFLLSRQWFVRAHHGAEPPRLRRYFQKRFLRIRPVYVVAVVAALTFIESNSDQGGQGWLTTLTMLVIYVNETLPAGLTQMWSLATEVAVYLLLPLLMLFVLPRRGPARSARVALLAGGMVAASVLWATVGAERLPTDVMAEQWLPAYTSWFAVGIVLAHLQVRHSAGATSRRTDAAIRTLTSSPGALWALAAGLLLVAATPLAGPTLLIPPTEHEAVVKNLLFAGVGGLLVFAGAFAEPGSGHHRLLSARWARHLGHISYGVFCLHLPILHFVMWSTGYQLFGGRFLEILVLTTVLSVLAAEVTYAAVERPFMRLATPRRGRAARTDTPTTEHSTT